MPGVANRVDFVCPNDATSQRQELMGIVTLGLWRPVVISRLQSSEVAQLHAFMSPNELTQGMERMVRAANSLDMHSYTSIETVGQDLPRKDTGIEVMEGQNVTFLAS